MSGIEELNDMFGRMPVALYRTTPEGDLLAANQALANLLGFESVEEAKQAFATVLSVYVHPAERARWLEEIDQAGIVYDFDVEFALPDGSTVWVQDTARAVKDENGVVRYYEGALIDQTVKMSMKKAKDEFLATVSHELRNPIAVILGMGEELANNYDTFSDEDRRDMAHLIARQADDASWLIEDLLVAYRDDVSRVPITVQEFDLVKAAERVLEVVDYPVSIEVRGADARVDADPRRVRQIVRNLVSNALRYGGEQVVVRIEPVGDRVELRVCDNGDQIDPAEVDRIFKPFETGTHLSQHPRSVGLGLSVARKLARLMEGDLTYRHTEGMSCFVLSLPTA
ncbi:MAG: PAS domain-containing sensor histidine kinase [Acidimicrobiia bacterium]